jgi:hypothetical protein
MKRIILAVVLIMSLSGVTVVRSQNKPMATPDILQKIMNWEGDWQANLTMKMGGKTSTSMDYISFSKASDGSAVSAKEWMDSPQGGKVYITHLVGYNPEDKKLHWFSVDNMGGCGEAIGTMPADNHIRLVGNSKQDGKPMKQTIDLTLKDNNTVEFNVVVTVDGKTVRSGMGTFTRKSSK